MRKASRKSAAGRTVGRPRYATGERRVIGARPALTALMRRALLTLRTNAANACEEAHRAGKKATPMFDLQQATLSLVLSGKKGVISQQTVNAATWLVACAYAREDEGENRSRSDSAVLSAAEAAVEACLVAPAVREHLRKTYDVWLRRTGWGGVAMGDRAVGAVVARLHRLGESDTRLRAKWDGLNRAIWRASERMRDAPSLTAAKRRADPMLANTDTGAAEAALGRRCALAVWRIVEPLLHHDASGQIERSGARLDDSEFANFVRHGIEREMILMRRKSDTEAATAAVAARATAAAPSARLMREGSRRRGAGTASGGRGARARAH